MILQYLFKNKINIINLRLIIIIIREREIEETKRDKEFVCHGIP